MIKRALGQWASSNTKGDDSDDSEDVAQAALLHVGQVSYALVSIDASVWGFGVCGSIFSDNLWLHQTKMVRTYILVDVSLVN